MARTAGRPLDRRSVSPPDASRNVARQNAERDIGRRRVEYDDRRLIAPARQRRRRLQHGARRQSGQKRIFVLERKGEKLEQRNELSLVEDGRHQHRHCAIMHEVPEHQIAGRRDIVETIETETGDDRGADEPVSRDKQSRTPGRRFGEAVAAHRHDGDRTRTRRAEASARDRASRAQMSSIATAQPTTIQTERSIPCLSNANASAPQQAKGASAMRPMTREPAAGATKRMTSHAPRPKPKAAASTAIRCEESGIIKLPASERNQTQEF